MAGAAAGGAAYFRRVGILWMTFVTVAMSFFTWTVFWPTTVPYEQLGPLGSFTQYMVKNHYSGLYYGFWVAWTLHVLEALYGVRLLRTKGITDPGIKMLWTIQTFLFGIGSLSLLLAYKPAKKRR
ncbi:transmembrane protein 254 [Leptodactylus fuscus]|uniref:transmembrane protein 254 n=1 Tax=Leptodactylus fuscus TaxID=238119 RepID=UPI003F4E7CAC